jgi:formylglycine-generating enzyme required for sulfatase activity
MVAQETGQVLPVDHQKPPSNNLADLNFTLEPRDIQTMVLRTANVRIGPASNFDLVAKLQAKTRVTVTGATWVAGHEWFAVLLDDGREGYIWAPLLRAGVYPERGAVKAPKSDNEASDTFRDCPACPEMVVVPAGEFHMGSSKDEIAYLIDMENAAPEWVVDEAPRHLVQFKSPFAVGMHEITKIQFSVFVSNTGHRAGRRCHIYKRGAWRNEASRTWRTPPYSKSDQEPVVCVNWHDATAYAAWLSKWTGHAYRLLSEAEWEYAARGGTDTRRFWGDDDDYNQACSHGNVSDLTRARSHRLRQNTDNIFMCEDGIIRRAPVGSFFPNGFGLHDMLGNVWEWTEDCYQDNYDDAPKTETARTTRRCIGRVLRGGSWDFDPRTVRSANRGYAAPGDRSGNVGFRVARDLD